MTSKPSSLSELVERWRWLLLSVVALCLILVVACSDVEDPEHWGFARSPQTDTCYEVWYFGRKGGINPVDDKYCDSEQFPATPSSTTE